MMVHQDTIVSGLVATGDTTLVTIGNRGYTKLCVHIAVATQALDNFDVLVKSHVDADARDVTPANWASLAATDYPGFLYSSGDLAALGAGANGYFEMNVQGLRQIVLEASAAVNGADVTLRWSLS